MKHSTTYRGPAASFVALTRNPTQTQLVPTFTHRVHNPPIARGHRAFVLGKAEWR